VLPCSVVLDGEFGYEDTAFGVPAKLGSNGVEEVVEWELDEYESDLLDEAAAEALRAVRENRVSEANERVTRILAAGALEVFTTNRQSAIYKRAVVRRRE